VADTVPPAAAEIAEARSAAEASHAMLLVATPL